MRRRIALVCLFNVVTTLGQAQESCESLITGLQDTLERTQTLTRTVNLKTGFIQIISNTSLLERTSNGVETMVLEHSGRQRDASQTPAGAEQAPENWLGALDLDNLSCDGHTLNTTGTQSYQLELVPPTDTSLQGLTLSFALSDDAYFLDTIHANAKASGLPTTADMQISFRDWQLLD